MLLREVSRTIDAVQTVLENAQIALTAEGSFKQDEDGQATKTFASLINANLTNPIDRTAELLKLEIKHMREAKQTLLAPRNADEVLVPSGNSSSSSSRSGPSSKTSSPRVASIDAVAKSMEKKHKAASTKILVSREVHAPGKDIDSLSSVLTEYMAWGQIDSGCLQFVFLSFLFSVWAFPF